MTYKIFFLLFVCLCTTCFAQRQVKADTSHIEKRLFSAEGLEKIKADKEFQYDRYKEPPKSLWDRFWSWFWSKISQFLSTEGGRTTMWTVFIIVGVAVIAYFIFKVVGMKEGGLFGRSSKDSLDYSISSDDIHRISFEEAIQDAIASSNFRLAIRLMYLQSLKKLSDSGYINWQLNKTNTDYLQETRDKKWHYLFSSLTYNFEYTWYGETAINKDRFGVVQQQFQQFNNQL
jgi:hypothetical protein